MLGPTSLVDAINLSERENSLLLNPDRANTTICYLPYHPGLWKVGQRQDKADYPAVPLR